MSFGVVDETTKAASKDLEVGVSSAPLGPDVLRLGFTDEGAAWLSKEASICTRVHGVGVSPARSPARACGASAFAFGRSLVDSKVVKCAATSAGVL